VPANPAGIAVIEKGIDMTSKTARVNAALKGPLIAEEMNLRAGPRDVAPLRSGSPSSPRRPWLVRTEDGVDVYPADSDTAAALEIPLTGEPDAEFERGVAWFGRYCVPDLARYVEWRGPYKTHDDAFDSLDMEYGSYCHGWGDVVKRLVADQICERSDRYKLAVPTTHSGRYRR
jgi:hypothetical protein